MATLERVQQNQIGQLDNLIDIRECNLVDEATNPKQWTTEIDPGANFQEIGPFNSTREYFNTPLSLQKSAQDQFSVGIYHLLSMMIHSSHRPFRQTL